MHVPPTAPESLLLAYLEKLVLRGVAELAPGSDAAARALRLLASVSVGGTGPRHGGGDGGVGGDREGGAGAGYLSPVGCFPNQAYRRMCEQALAAVQSAGGKFREGEKDFLRWGEEEEEEESGEGEDEEQEVNGGGGGGGDGTHLMNLMDLALAADELGSETTWGWLLHELEAQQERQEEWREQQQQMRHEEENGIAVAPAGGEDLDGDPELDDTIHVLKTFLPPAADHDSSAASDDDGGGYRRGGYSGPGDDGGVGAGAGRESAQAGSKLESVVQLLREHKERCESAGGAAGRELTGTGKGPLRFSALVLVSTRELAQAAPGILESTFGATITAGGGAVLSSFAVTTTRPRSWSCSSHVSLDSAFSVPSAEETAEPRQPSSSPSPPSVRAVCAVGTPNMNTADQVDALEAFAAGAADVLVSTPEYYGGGRVQQVPRGALVVVCLNPSPGPARSVGDGEAGGGGQKNKAIETAANEQLERLRGRIRCDGNFR